MRLAEVAAATGFGATAGFAASVVALVSRAVLSDWVGLTAWAAGGVARVPPAFLLAGCGSTVSYIGSALAAAFLLTGCEFRGTSYACSALAAAFLLTGCEFRGTSYACSALAAAFLLTGCGSTVSYIGSALAAAFLLTGCEFRGTSYACSALAAAFLLTGCEFRGTSYTGSGATLERCQCESTFSYMGSTTLPDCPSIAL